MSLFPFRPSVQATYVSPEASTAIVEASWKSMGSASSFTRMLGPHERPSAEEAL